MIQCLEKCCIAVMTVVYMLTEIQSVAQYKVFLEEKHKSLCQCEDHWELFSMLNFYWNYLSPDLLDQLLEELIQKESSFEDISKEMEKYNSDLQKFRQHTTLKLFCQADIYTSTECDPPPEFRKIVIEHKWPDTVTLEDVEKFRRRYSQTYNLQRCAMMLYNMGVGGGGGAMPVVGEESQPPSVRGSRGPVLAKGIISSRSLVYTSTHHVVPETTTDIPTGTVNLYVDLVLN